MTQTTTPQDGQSREASRSDYRIAQAIATRSDLLDQMVQGRTADWSSLTRLVEAEITQEIEIRVGMIAANSTKVAGTTGVTLEEAQAILADRFVDELLNGLHDGNSTNPMSNAIDSIRRDLMRRFVGAHRVS